MLYFGNRNKTKRQFLLHNLGSSQRYKDSKIAATSDSGGKKRGKNPPEHDIYDPYFELAYQELDESKRLRFDENFPGYNNDMEKLRKTDKIQYQELLRSRHQIIRIQYGTEEKSEVVKGLSEALDRESLHQLLKLSLIDFDENQRSLFKKIFPYMDNCLAKARENDPILYMAFLEYRHMWIWENPLNSQKDNKEFIDSEEQNDDSEEQNDDSSYSI